MVSRAHISLPAERQQEQAGGRQHVQLCRWTGKECQPVSDSTCDSAVPVDRQGVPAAPVRDSTCDSAGG